MAADSVVSVVIPTLNSESTIGSCLESIFSQTYDNLEVIVVDSYSRDQTASIAKQHGAFVLSTTAKRSEARNDGAEMAKGSYLMFIDSDMTLEQQVIEQCVNECRSKRFDAITVPEVSIGKGFWSRCIALEKKIYLDNQLIESPCFFTRECFSKLGGYDEKLEAGEDWDLNTRLFQNNFSIGRTKSVIDHNEGRITLKKLFRKKYYYGKSITEYSRTNPQLSRAQLSPLRFVNSTSISSMMNSPLYALGMILMKGIEFSGLIIGSISG